MDAKGGERMTYANDFILIGQSTQCAQEPITRSLHLPYYSSEPTLSRIFLFLEAPPTEVFAGVFVITNHERAAVTHCLQVTGNQSYLHLHGLHDSKRKLMFFVHRLIPQRFDRF